MRYAHTLQPKRRRYFNRCVALFAAIFLVTAPGAAQATPSQPEAAWPQELQKDPALLAEFGQLVTKLQHNVQLPPPRSESHLLPFLHESTVFYVAFPNYGNASHQALTIFQQELKESPALHAWWHRGDMATNGPKVEDAFEKFYQLSQFLGDEIVVSATTEGRQGPSVLILAEIKKPGLKGFLERMAKDLAGPSKPPVRVFDVQELTTVKDTFPPQEPVILVRPDLLVAALDFGQLRIFNAMLDGKRGKFAASPFGLRVAQAYEGGTTVVGAIDLQTILKQVPPGANQKTFQQSGFDEMKYLVWDHKTVVGHAASEAELSFVGPRHGIASWLAAPGPMGSLDFVSPKVVMASTLLLKNPAEIFDDVRDLSAASNSKAFDSITQMEAAFKLSLKEDLLRHLGGEITFELDSLKPPDPIWKVILQVNDPDRLQATFNTLLAAMHFNPQQSTQEGFVYHTLQIPSGKRTIKIGYAFADGYLVAASSPETITEALRLHRSGESLAKSGTFLASLPPGHGTEVSAFFYENPTAMAALGMRQVFPGMAESLSQATSGTPPVVVCAYAEPSAIREASMSGGVDVGVVLAAAAIAIPNLLRARIAANESSAVAAIRTANTAEISYASEYPQRGFAPDLATLGPDPRGPGDSSADHASFIDSTLGNAKCTAGAWCTKSGFQFSITAVCKKQGCREYVVVGTPLNGSTGTRSFCSTSEAVIRFKTGPPLASPVSVSECQSWQPLQ